MKHFYTIEEAKREMLLFFMERDTDKFKVSSVLERLDYPEEVKVCQGTSDKICSSCKFHYLHLHRLNNLDGKYEIVNYFGEKPRYGICDYFEEIFPSDARTFIHLDVDFLPELVYYLSVLPFIMSLYDELK